jgi:hypothetical protein
MEDKVHVKTAQLHAKEVQKGGRGIVLPVLEPALKGMVSTALRPLKPQERAPLHTAQVAVNIQEAGNSRKEVSLMHGVLAEDEIS